MVGSQHHASCASSPGIRPGTHAVGGYNVLVKTVFTQQYK